MYILVIMHLGQRFLVAVSSLLLLLLPKVAASADHWVEVHSPHFTVSSNAGEKEARRIANQFEEIRAVFLMAFPSLRVDPGKPLIVLAVKDENSLKTLLPDYWTAKDRVRPAGIFVPGLDRNFAVLRTDVTGSGENAYHHLYHEYMHMIVRLNFAALPTWLDEGLAEYFGNTVVDSHEIGVGRIDRRQLELLKRTQLIPIQTLLKVDQRSPLYNEQDRASIFYAESWLLVHYLLQDPEARKAQYFFRFLKAMDEKNDPEENGKEAFGDLNHFERKLEDYARQPIFQYQRYKPQAPISDKDYPVRDLSPAETQTVQADFLAHAGHARDARTALKQAIEQEPTLAAGYTSLGYIDYLLHENDAAESEFNQAISLNQNDFRPYHFRALLILRNTGYRKESTPLIIANLEKVTALNPDFAPAYGFLSVAYRQQEDTKRKSFDADVKAAKLEPANLTFTVDIGDALLALGRDREASELLERMNKAARTAYEKSMTEAFAKRLASHKELAARKEGAIPLNAPASADSDTTEPGSSPEQTVPSKAADHESSSEEGIIREVTCNAPSGISMRFAILGETLVLAAANPEKLVIHVAGKEATLSDIPCEQWKGRKARVSYMPPSGENKPGEISSIDFF